MVVIFVFIIVGVAGLLFHRAAIARAMIFVAAMRTTADEALWRRYNVVGDMAAWAANNGAPGTQALFDRVLAARDDVITHRSNIRVRLAAEDTFQTALNAFYAAAYRDDDLLGVHEWVVTAARALKADESAHAAVSAHDAAVHAFSARHAPWLLALYRLPAPSPIGLTVPYRHPSPADQPLA